MVLLHGFAGTKAVWAPGGATAGFGYVGRLSHNFFFTDPGPRSSGWCVSRLRLAANPEIAAGEAGGDRRSRGDPVRTRAAIAVPA